MDASFFLFYLTDGIIEGTYLKYTSKGGTDEYFGCDFFFNFW